MEKNMIHHPSIRYNKEDDILTLTNRNKVKESIDHGNFIIDIDTDGFISGIEILNATDMLRMSEEQLHEIQDASMTVDYMPDHVRISLILHSKEKEKDITIPLAMRLGHEEKRSTTFAAV